MGKNFCKKLIKNGERMWKELVGTGTYNSMAKQLFKTNKIMIKKPFL